MSDAKDAVSGTPIIADGGCLDTGLLIAHRRERRQAELPTWGEHNSPHRKARSRVEHVLDRLPGWKIRGARHLNDGVSTTPSGIAVLHDDHLAIAG